MEDEREAVDRIMTNASALNDVDCVASFNEWNRVWNDDWGFSCEPNCDFLFKAFTGSSNTENILLGAQPANFDYFRRFLAKHLPEFHAQGMPRTNSTLSEGGMVYLSMVQSGDFCDASAPVYTTLFLESSLDVMVYSSNLDPLIGPASAAAGVRAAWDFADKHLTGGSAAKSAFYQQKKEIWRVAPMDVEPAGYARCLRLAASRFCYVVVRNAGHETTSYAPRAAYDLNQRFIRRQPFGGHALGVPDCAACGGA
eukprot:CAMPEP_0179158472 /NCGR_PEP_ID=MMETSP0796-20121207/77329_1 /TAXON_ID=73915 /ORGANISM="Pyrodinium bahamense, Strain pbaha01" /LENGTH=253 /DNA_ID=CAMNT_0020860147 /DNA_START=29 /DNA_END=787 /DNA_ORIENTATION=+